MSTFSFGVGKSMFCVGSNFGNDSENSLACLITLSVALLFSKAHYFTPPIVNFGASHSIVLTVFTVQNNYSYYYYDDDYYYYHYH